MCTSLELCRTLTNRYIAKSAALLLEFCRLYSCCLLLVQSELDVVAEHRTELKFFILEVMLNFFVITVLYFWPIFSSWYPDD